MSIKIILDDLVRKISTNPETSNYIWKEDDEAIKETEKALTAYVEEIIGKDEIDEVFDLLHMLSKQDVRNRLRAEQRLRLKGGEHE